MSTAELLPDNTNMINEDGDVVAIDAEPVFEDTVATSEDTTEDPAEAYRSPNFFSVINTIEEGIEKSVSSGYRIIKIGNKPLGQYLAIDVFKALPNDEAKMIVEKYTARASERLGSSDTNHAIGGRAVEFAANAIYPDVRMLAANDDTFKD